ncbi:hypothetical protein BGP80_14900 [Pseudomonas putida]|uniref:Uncharacterized protein n=1 Tax=Pseudomonas putida TaxID=303 RepID=A0A2S3WDY8_PSEPU|nr:hypothetical protein BGP80_14900 [Pseudomonas putida]
MEGTSLGNCRANYRDGLTMNSVLVERWSEQIELGALPTRSMRIRAAGFARMAMRDRLAAP